MNHVLSWTKRSVWVAVALGMLACGSRSSAQIVTVSAKPVQAWIDDIRLLGQKVLPAPLAQPLLDALEKLTAPNMLKGLDRTRSFGGFADLPVGGESPLVALCVPVTDSKEFLLSLKSLGFGVEDQPGSQSFSHVVTLPNGSTKLYAAPAGKYLYLSLFPGRASRFRELKPSEFDVIRPKSSELTISARLDRIPAPLREQFIKSFQERVAAMSQRNPGEPEAEFIGRLTGQELTSDLFLSLLKECREIALDVELDPKAGPIALELRVAAQRDSEMAKSFKSFGERRSLFRGLGPDSVLDTFAVIPVPKRLHEGMSKLAALSRKDAEAKITDPKEKDAARLAWNLMQSILNDDTYDLVWAIRGPYAGKEPANKTFVVIFGLMVKDTKELDKTIRSDAIKTQVGLDVGKSNDGKVTIHELKSNQNVLATSDRMLGKMKIQFAILEKSVLVAVGEESLKGLQEAIDLVGKPRDDTKAQALATLDVANVMNFSNTEVEREAAAAAAKEVFQGKDASKRHVNLSLQGEAETLRLRLSADVALLKFIIEFGMRAQAGGRP